MADNTSMPNAPTSAPKRGTYAEGRAPLKEISQLDVKRFKLERAVFAMGKTLNTISSLARVVVSAGRQMTSHYSSP